MKTNRKMILVGGAAGLLILAGLLALSRGARSRPPQAATPEQTISYLASEAFVKMAADDKREYLRAIEVHGSRTPVLTLVFNPSVADDQRRRVLENVLPVVGPVIDQRLEEFDRLGAAERTVRLDAVIDQWEAARRDHPGTMSSLERLSLVLQYLDPHTRANLRKHMPALLVRMKERGIRTAFPL